jgi:hypothetical protein
MTGRASRDRGARAERAVVNHLRTNGWPDARRHHGADGRAPGDIMGVPGVTIEVKDRASSAWPTWRQQLLAETPAGDLALLIRRVRGVADVGQWDAEMPWRDWRWLDGAGRYAGFPCKRTQELWVRVTVDDVLALLTPVPAVKDTEQ